MMKHLLLPLLLIGLLMQPAQPARAQAPAPEGGFGYSMGYVTYDWEELYGQAGVSEVQFASDDDAVSCVPDQTGYCAPTPIPLGLDFPFFENTYSDVYVSINGVLLFGEPPVNSYRLNDAIPRDFPPQNIIAIYWDDLILDAAAGAVYYKNYAAPCPVGNIASACTIIEYYQVLKFGEEGSQPFNIEAILYANGDIRIGFQGLPQLTDECTVGIEDDQGVTGHQFIYNQTGLAPTTMLQFTYPGVGYRVKAFPLVSGAFLNERQIDLPFTLRNTGTETDTYTFSYALMPGSQGTADGWTFSFIDSNGNPITGGLTLQPGLLSQQEIRLRITAPETAQRGDYAQAQINIQSPNIAPYTIIRQTSVAAPFTLISLDTNRIQVHYQLEHKTYRGPVFTGYTGGSVALAHQTEAIYLPYWTQLGVDLADNIYINALIARLNVVGNNIGPRPLYQHSQQTLGARDESTMLASIPDGLGAAVFLRRSNPEWIAINYARLSLTGRALGDPIVLMDNDGLNTRQLASPAVTVLPDNRFLVTWDYYDTNISDLSIGDIYYAVLNNDGSLAVPPTSLTSAVYGGPIYDNTSLLPLANGQVLVVYQRYDEALSVLNLVYRVLTPGGSTGTEILIEADVDLTQVDLAMLSDNHPLLAWVAKDMEDEFSEARFAVLNADASDFVLEPTALPQPDERPAEKLSVAADTQGNGVLVWGEVYTQRLYYTLVNSSGTVLTPPMTFRQAVPDRLLLLASDGGSLAYCPDVLTWNLSLPAVLK